MPTIVSKNENFPLEIPYLYEYKVAILTPKTALAKMYTIKNELALVIKIPKSDYKNEDYQKLVACAKSPVYDKDYYRDLGVRIIEGKFERSVVFTHAMITRFEEEIETKADYITATVVFEQKLDKTSGVKLGGNYDETFDAAFEKVNNPSRLRIFTGNLTNESSVEYAANPTYANLYTISADKKSKSLAGTYIVSNDGKYLTGIYISSSKTEITQFHMLGFSKTLETEMVNNAVAQVYKKQFTDIKIVINNVSTIYKDIGYLVDNYVFTSMYKDLIKNMGFKNIKHESSFSSFTDESGKEVKISLSNTAKGVKLRDIANKLPNWTLDWDAGKNNEGRLTAIFSYNGMFQWELKSQVNKDLLEFTKLEDGSYWATINLEIGNIKHSFLVTDELKKLVDSPEKYKIDDTTLSFIKHAKNYFTEYYLNGKIFPPISVGSDEYYAIILHYAIFGNKLIVDWSQGLENFANLCDIAGSVFSAKTGASNVNVNGSKGPSNKLPSAKNLYGSDFEDYLTTNIGGKGSFSIGGRDFDGGVGNRWWEAKSGSFWESRVNDPKAIAKFKSDMGDRLRIATENGATYELFSNTPIPQIFKDYLTKKGIPFTEILH